MSKSKAVREIDWERVRVELAGTIQAAREENTTLISYNSETGEAWSVSPDGTVEPYEIVSQTNWERNAAMTDEEIEAAIASDPDDPGDDWVDHAVVVRGHGRGVTNGT